MISGPVLLELGSCVWETVTSDVVLLVPEVVVLAEIGNETRVSLLSCFGEPIMPGDDELQLCPRKEDLLVGRFLIGSV